jgi:hypothetical protein
MVNYSAGPGRLLYRPTPGEAPFGDSGRICEGRETRGMRANNKNRHPRGEARQHMGLRIHVPAGISLSVDRLPFSLIAPRRLPNDAFGSE